MIYNCLLVDDEPLALNVLENYIQYLPTLKLIGKCNNAFEAIKYIQEGNVDILFLDIHMPQLTGTEFLKNLRTPPKVIFTTAYKDFAIEAFDLDAVDYLLKPISLQRFIKAVSKVDSKAFQPMVQDIQTENNSGPSFLYFRSDRKMVKVFLDDILFIESLKDYIKIVLASGKPLVVKQSISGVEEMLPKNKFLRIHRSFIVSINKVNAYTQQDVEIEGHEIPIGKAYLSQVPLLSKAK